MSDALMEEAWANGAARIPEEICLEIYEATNDGRPTGWPEFTDRDCDVWQLTGEMYDGDAVMMPCASDMMPLLRRDVERRFGPLAPFPER